MTASRGLALFLSVGVAGAFAHAAGPGPASSTTAVARLTAISSRTHVKGASLVIEASQPVAYVATRPDALTVSSSAMRVDPADARQKCQAVTPKITILQPTRGFPPEVGGAPTRVPRPTGRTRPRRSRSSPSL